MKPRSRNVGLTAALASGTVAVMLGVAFASPTLYRLFCETTGYAGTPKTENVARSVQLGDGMVTVRFDANVNSALPWHFQPAQRDVHVRLGEETLAHYTAVNTSDRPVTGTATFNILPEKAAQYFAKIECFCFTEQTLAPGQEISMPVLFYVDPALAEDANARDATTITLSYTFYRIEGATAQKGNAATIAAAPAAAGAGG